MTSPAQARMIAEARHTLDTNRDHIAFELACMRRAGRSRATMYQQIGRAWGFFLADMLTLAKRR